MFKFHCVLASSVLSVLTIHLPLVAQGGNAKYQESASLDGSMVAYVNSVDGDAEIYIEKVDGAERLRLTNNEFNDNDPSWSPDGKGIAFASDRTGIWQIYRMGSDGGGVVQLTEKELGCVLPRYGPQGQLAYLISRGRKRKRDLFDLVIENGDSIERLDQGIPIYGYAWHPNGEHIGWASDGRFMLHNVRQGTTKRVKLEDTDPRLTSYTMVDCQWNEEKQGFIGRLMFLGGVLQGTKVFAADELFLVSLDGNARILMDTIEDKGIDADPISALVKSIDASYGLRLNGATPIVTLPPDSSINEVLAESVKAYGGNFPEGYITTCKIREVRNITLNGQSVKYTACLVQSDLGTNVWLFCPLPENLWFARFFAVPNDELLVDTEPKVIASGKWSDPVVDEGGYAVQGRMVICEKSVTHERFEVVLYVELRDATSSVGRSLRLYCDMGKTDSAANERSGLQCELKDSNGHAVEAAATAFGGAVPTSQWVTLPSDATIRLRASPFGIHRSRGITISPYLGTAWVIDDNDSGEHTLSGKFVINPPEETLAPSNAHVWKGTIYFPSVRILGRSYHNRPLNN